MRVSREQVGENRRRILDSAGQLFRERGFDAVTVAEVMKAAGLTHGAFYGHFQSKDDLIAQTLGHVLEHSPVGDELDAFIDFYLSADHCAHPSQGCAIAGLGADSVRQAAPAREAMTSGLRRHLQRMTALASGEDEAQRRRQAIGTWSALVGAVILARLSDDPALSAEVLTQTRKWIGEASAASGSQN